MIQKTFLIPDVEKGGREKTKQGSANRLIMPKLYSISCLLCPTSNLSQVQVMMHDA